MLKQTLRSAAQSHRDIWKNEAHYANTKNDNRDHTKVIQSHAAYIAATYRSLCRLEKSLKAKETMCDVDPSRSFSSYNPQLTDMYVKQASACVVFFYGEEYAF